MTTKLELFKKILAGCRSANMVLLPNLKKEVGLLDSGWVVDGVSATRAMASNAIMKEVTIQLGHENAIAREVAWVAATVAITTT